MHMYSMGYRGTGEKPIIQVDIQDIQAINIVPSAIGNLEEPGIRVWNWEARN